jgi:integrase
MQPLDPIEVWLNNVAVAHSNSERTANKYKGNLQEFCNFVDKTPQQMLEEYENHTDREFKKKYTQYLRAYISHLFKRELAPNSIRCSTGAVRSFFKYNDLPLGYIPSARARVIHHNREITREEVVQIIEASGIRERAFYAIMAQSGLRPYTLTQLKFSNIKEDFDNENNESCVIYVPEEVTKGKYIPYFTFTGKYAMDKLRAYLRPNIRGEDYIFTKQGTEKPANSRSISSLFLRTVLELQEKDKIKDLKQKEKG